MASSWKGSGHPKDLQLNPNYLHSNSTSHTWPFSAIAELIDNAYDPDVCAKQLWIDKTQIKGVDCLTFMDNGAGMDYDAMYKLLSFGFSDKRSLRGHAAVGMYGNGFKSGSMRLGKDVIVFSKRRNSMSVGMLSQTYLKETKASNIIVPIVTYNRVGKDMASMQKILKYSLFQTEEAILSELKAINATKAKNTSGTRIIIWNLRRTESGKLEFDFDTECYDIQIPADMSDGTQTKFRRQERNAPTVPDTDFSLRAYCSILYLKPRMQIIIRGQKVKTQLVSKSLAHVIMDKYKPNFLKQAVSITFGYSTMGKDNYGVMMYHKNRLIKAYERVGCQLRANTKGVGVIGVIECNFLKPTHNKQDFDYTDEYRKTMSSLGAKLEDYWKEIQHKRNTEYPNCPPVEDVEKQPDQDWVQCDECLKWRKLPDGINIKQLPENWFCHMNPDPNFRCTHTHPHTHTYTHIMEDNAQFETPESHMEFISERSSSPMLNFELFGEGESSTWDCVPPGLCEERLLLEGQAQQGHQMELLSTTRQERDNYKSMVDHLTSQVDDLQKQLFQKEVKNAQAEHGTQTDEVEKKDYRAQFQHVTEIIKKLKKERDAFINVMSVLSQLHQLNEIIDDLVRATIEAEECNCRYPGEDMAQNTEVILNEEDRRAATASNLCHLLVSIIPTLDLQQVNYDSNVIDEIVDKVLKEMSHDEKNM
uniref:CW-type domain-containing protein n=1 Tax=Denticeps clupeoides TaxID=299321 RepID=A0AAY4D7S8_9TELE